MMGRRKAMPGVPTVSVITPTYNHRAYIGPCIESVLVQSHRDWEMTIVDDGSTDGTPNIARQYRDPRIRYVAQPHGGIFTLARRYNLALSLSRTPFVAILEGDDFWPADRLETLLPAFRDEDVVLAYGISQGVDAGGRIIERVKYPADLPADSRFPLGVLLNDPIGSAVKAMLLLDRTFPATCGTMIRRSALDAIGGFAAPKNMALVDRPTYFQLGMRGKFAYVPKITGYYRRHSENYTANLDTAEGTVRGLMEYVTEFIREHGERLQLTNAERARIEAMWRNNWTGILTLQGRTLLVAREWEQASAKFLQVLRESGQARRTAVAALGYASSYIRQDIEWLFRSLGKPYVAPGMVKDP